jgi:Holliday junction DNA helicase RuvA
MFAYIKGIIAEKELSSHGAHRMVLECQGFGMEMQVSQQTFLALPEIGEEAQIYTVFVIKESEAILFGFANVQEKELFMLLTSVSGIGPKLALGLLGTFKPEQLCQAILQEEEKVITQAPGVGAKVAGRIVLELKTKIEAWQEKT